MGSSNGFTQVPVGKKRELPCSQFREACHNEPDNKGSDPPSSLRRKRKKKPIFPFQVKQQSLEATFIHSLIFTVQEDVQNLIIKYLRKTWFNLERWFSSQEHPLLLQRTECSSQQQHGIAYNDLGYDTSADKYIYPYTNTYTYTRFKMKYIFQKVLWIN